MVDCVFEKGVECDPLSQGLLPSPQDSGCVACQLVKLRKDIQGVLKPQYILSASTPEEVEKLKELMKEV